MELPAHAFLESALRRTRRPRRAAAASVALALAGALTVLGGAPQARATSGSMLPGIDVSHHNGTVDWQQVKAAGYKFAFAKATEGTGFVDPLYAANRSGTAAAHMAFGAYHFARPSGSTSDAIAADAKAEADWFIDNAKPKPGDLLPVLDLETSGGLSIPHLQAWTWGFLNEVVARIHERPIIYSGNYFWATYMGDTTQYADAGFKLLWVPHWTTDPQPRVPAKDWGGLGWTFWQYTATGTVPGVTGARSVDLDRFNGTDLTSVEMGIPPTNATPPSVSGTAEETATLTAGNGAWHGTSPFDYAYRWIRCDSGGGDCAYIPGADQQRYTLTAADIGTTVSVEVTAANALGSATADSGSTEPVEPFDVTPPSVPVFTAPASRYVVSTQVPVAWSSTDNRSGVGSYHVRVRFAAAAGGFGGFRDVFATTPSTQTTFAGQAGHSYCFSAMATDRWSNASGWSGERCTTVPADDRSFARSAGWSGERAPGFFLGTALASTTRGAT
ncbi:MAG TPA: glycoside hydrolase family 25 protein, partial [Actinomycetota bacterium]|nr:glycoside hydrolase family 25 protein [Actinomycetota bacterium]